MGLDPSNLPENLRRAMLREPDPRSRQAMTWNCPHCGFTNGSLTAKCAECHKLPWKKTNPAPGDSITFWVDGKPEPAGSKQAFCPTKPDGEPYRGPGGRIIINVVDDNPKSKEWKKVVARAARQHFTREPHDGPVECRFDFIVTRPQYHFGTGKNAEKLKDAAPHFPTVKPDTLKLSRGTEDALTGICWIDDSQVVNQTATKRYGTQPGVQITIRAVTVINPGNTRPTQPELTLPPAPAAKPEPEDQLPLP